MTVVVGSTNTYTVGLAAQPAGPVTVGPASNTSGAITRAPGALTFDATTRRLPGAAAVATYRLTVMNVNESTAPQDFALTVAANPLPGFTTAATFWRHPLNQAVLAGRQELPAPTDRQPTFGNATVEPQRYTVGTAVTLALPAAANGDGRLTYTLTPPGLPAGLTYTPPAAADTTGGTLAGTPTAVHPATTYTLTATGADRDPAELAFTVEVGAAGAMAWTAGWPGSATPGEDYHAVAAG